MGLSVRSVWSGALCVRALRTQQLALLVVFGCGSPVFTTTDGQEDAPAETSTLSAALAGDEDAVETLRGRGRSGFAALRQQWIDQGEPHATEWAHLLDRVAAQRDAGSSGLYWETDLDAALVEAKRRQVPVLSLRMLGELTDEHSCANSRFFRTVLYSHPDLSRWLDEHFVLHWSSERPVPQVTIDFGDGRTIHTTTTGNSAHYVLDTDGRPIDVVPGLYAPAAFSVALQQSLALFQDLRKVPETVRELRIREHHRKALAEAKSALHASLWNAFDSLPGPLDAWIRDPSSRFDPDQMARDAGLLGMSKSGGESLVRNQIVLSEMNDALTGGDPLRRQDLLVITAPVHLHPEAMALVRRDRPARPGESSADYEARIAALRLRFEQSIAIDTVINEYKLRSAIRLWFANGEAPDTFENLNERVYAEVFLTPRADPWLGVVDDQVYDALREAGIATLPG